MCRSARQLNGIAQNSRYRLLAWDVGLANANHSAACGKDTSGNFVDQIVIALTLFLRETDSALVVNAPGNDPVDIHEDCLHRAEGGRAGGLCYVRCSPSIILALPEQRLPSCDRTSVDQSRIGRTFSARLASLNPSGLPSMMRSASCGYVFTDR